MKLKIRLKKDNPSRSVKRLLTIEGKTYEVGVEEFVEVPDKDLNWLYYEKEEEKIVEPEKKPVKKSKRRRK